LSLHRRSTEYDLFISYSYSDVAVVQKLAELLRGYGLRIFLDKWEVRLGAVLVEVIEAGHCGCGGVELCGYIDPGPIDYHHNFFDVCMRCSAHRREGPARDATGGFLPQKKTRSGGHFHPRQQDYCREDISLENPAVWG
jgi:hypothetical protein